MNLKLQGIYQCCHWFWTHNHLDYLIYKMNLKITDYWQNSCWGNYKLHPYTWNEINKSSKLFTQDLFGEVGLQFTTHRFLHDRP